MELMQKNGKRNFYTNAILAAASKDVTLHPRRKRVLQKNLMRHFSTLDDSLFPTNSLQQ